MVGGVGGDFSQTRFLTSNAPTDITTVQSKQGSPAVGSRYGCYVPAKPSVRSPHG